MNWFFNKARMVRLHEIFLVFLPVALPASPVTVGGSGVLITVDRAF